MTTPISVPMIARTFGHPDLAVKSRVTCVRVKRTPMVILIPLGIVGSQSL